MISWTNVANNGKGAALGGNAWTATGIPLVAEQTNLIIVTGTASSWAPSYAGSTTFNDTLAAKRFEMLHEIVPTMDTAALMWVPINPQQVLLQTLTKEAARTLGIKLLSLPIKAANDISPALATPRPTCS